MVQINMAVPPLRISALGHWRTWSKVSGMSALQRGTYFPMQASTRTAGRSFGRKVTLRSSIKPIAPPGLSA